MSTSPQLRRNYPAKIIAQSPCVFPYYHACSLRKIRVLRDRYFQHGILYHISRARINLRAFLYESGGVEAAKSSIPTCNGMGVNCGLRAGDTQVAS